MKIKFSIILSILFLFIASCKKEKEAIQITESNYSKADEKLWEDYNVRATEIDNLKSTNKDSIKNLYKILEKETDKKNIDLAIKYANTESGFKRIYILRDIIDKSILLEAYNKVRKELKDSKYGKSLKSYIESEQVTKGSNFHDFKVIDVNGESLSLSDTIKDKNVLLIYGGLKCIGSDGREYLKELYDKTRNSNLEFVVFEPSSNLSDFKKLASRFKSEYTFISDLLLDHSPMKINYGVQVKPTSFLIDKNGIIIEATEGIPDEKIKKLFIKN